MCLSCMLAAQDAFGSKNFKVAPPTNLQILEGLNQSIESLYKMIIRMLTKISIW
jgi:hypothetical protein